MYIRQRKIGLIPHELTDTIINCRRCKLWEYRKKVVIGQGTLPAQILFMGEAPGKTENISGIPFFGVSGKFLEEMIKDAMSLAGINRTPSYYITNAILCRPCDSIGGQNRLPKAEEIAMCSPLVNEIVHHVNPNIVVFVGDISFRFYKKEFPKHIKIFHPSFLIRKGGKGCQYYSQTIRALSEILKGV